MRFLRYLSAMALVVGSTGVNYGQSSQVQPAGSPFPRVQMSQPRLDIGKGTIERPFKVILKGTKANNDNPFVNLPPNGTVQPGVVPTNPKDVGKRKIELPTKHVLAGTRPVLVVPQAAAPAAPARKDRGKGFIEGPAKAILAGAQRGPNPRAVAPKENPPVKPNVPKDITKEIVEFRPKEVLAISQPGNTTTPEPAVDPGKADVGKYQIEVPAKTVITNTTVPISSATPVAEDNPTVEAGKVKWHASFEAACAAAKKSGKPVLLFQMMGELDQQFC